jgi:hypothetical protein
MNLRLGELLIKKNMLTKAQLEEALQAQVIFGGKLGTVLIEMGLISEGGLAEILAQQLSVPCAQPGQLHNIPEAVIKIISPELAEKHKVVPVAVAGKKLTLAMAEPHNLKSIDEIAFRTGYIVRPILALEVRLVFALEEYYGIKRAMRYIAPPRRGRDELNQVHIFETPKGPVVATETDEDLGMPGSEWVTRSQRKPENLLSRLEELTSQGFVEDVDEEESVTLATTVEDLVEEVDEEESITLATTAQDLAEDVDEEESVTLATTAQDLSEGVDEEESITLAATVQALVNVTDRDDVADAVIAYLGAHYARSALFMVVAGQVTGWRSAKDRRPIPGFDQFQTPLTEPSILKTAVESKSFFLGPVPQSGANLALAAVLGKPAPKTALLVPMSMLGRVVGLVYVDDAAADLSQAVVDVQQLVNKALLAFELLILHNKILRL